MSVPLQSEFPLRVAVCAWCTPKNRRVDLGSGLGSISHGICLRHMKQLMLELKRRKGGDDPVMPTRSRRRRTILNHPELNYQS